MQIGNRFRCYPTGPQAQVLLRWIGCQRFIYNAKVSEDQYFRRFARKSLGLAGQYAPIDQQYSQFKSDELTPWLNDVPSQVLRNGAVLWKQAYSRFFQKLGGRPAIHRKHGAQSIWLTSELFCFKPVKDPDSGEILGYTIELGTKKFPVGVLEFIAHKKFDPAASIHISVQAGRWHLSFNYDDKIPEPSEEDTLAWLGQHNEPELLAITQGLDRGVQNPLTTSDGRVFGFSDIQQERLLKADAHKKRWQRRMARRQKGSRNYAKARQKVARYQRYGADVRRDVAHKTSHELASNPNHHLFVFEDLRIQQMTKKAKPKQDEAGRWIKNGAAAKSGLNKSILTSTWSQTHVYLRYKAKRRGKLVIEVPAFYSSQECAQCGHTHPDNRLTQAEFVCQSCGHTDHADHNAARVIAARGVQHVLQGKCVKKEKKKARVTRTKQESKNSVGVEISEPAKDLAIQGKTPGEIRVRRKGGNTLAQQSKTQETPARPQG